MSDSYLLVYCTCPNHETGRRIAALLVDAHHAACVNVLPGVTAFYHWKGKLQQDEETLLMIKTTRAAYPGVQTLITQHHPYELPEIIAVPIQAGLRGYLDWLDQCTAKPVSAQEASSQEESS